MTTGISPKVLVPFLALVLVGVGCVVAGALVHEQLLQEVGYSVLGTAGVGGVLGYRASPGEVNSTFIPGGVNDAQLDQLSNDQAGATAQQ